MNARSLAWLVVIGCSAHDPPTPAAPPFPTCSDVEVPRLLGACVPVGVTACGSGFVRDAARATCEPVLPEACAAGSLAVPGDAACRPVQACADDPWFSTPEAGTLHVDGAAVGSVEDGSRKNPFRTIGAALVAAVTRSIPRVAVTDGNYGEVLDVPPGVALVGRCPERVVIDGGAADGSRAAVRLTNGAQLAGVAVTSAPAWGVAATGEVTLERVRIFGTGKGGLLVGPYAATARVVLRDSLVEKNRSYGALVESASLVLERSVIRDGRSLSKVGGSGVLIRLHVDRRSLSSVAVRGSVLERNESGGIVGMSAEVLVEDSVLREHFADPSDGDTGEGIHLVPGAAAGDPELAKVTVQRSLVSGNVGAGILVSRRDPVEGAGGAVLVDKTVVRGTKPRRGKGGVGVEVSLRSTLTVRDSVVEQNHVAGVLAFGAEVDIARTIARDTLPDDELDLASGFHLQAASTGTPTRAHMVDVLALGNGLAGIAVVGAELTFEGGRAARTRAAAAGLFGDGLVAMGGQGAGGATVLARIDLRGVLLDSNARAGLSLFGVDGTLADTALSCNPLDLVLDDRLREMSDGNFVRRTPTLRATGAFVVCGCAPVGPCVAATAEPPRLGRR